MGNYIEQSQLAEGIKSGYSYIHCCSSAWNDSSRLFKFENTVEASKETPLAYRWFFGVKPQILHMRLSCYKSLDAKSSNRLCNEYCALF